MEELKQPGCLEPEDAGQTRFAGLLTVMCTRIVNVAPNQNDPADHQLIRLEDDIVKPAIEDNHGKFVHSTGDGTLACFGNPLDAVRAAARIQRNTDALNMSQTSRLPVLMRIGMHSGEGAIDEGNASGDVVNTAALMASASDTGGILMSENTRNALPEKLDIYCRFVKQVAFPGGNGALNAYKAFWNPREIELDQQVGTIDEYPETTKAAAKHPATGLVWLAALAAAILLPVIATKYFSSPAQAESRHSIRDSATPADDSVIQR